MSDDESDDEMYSITSSQAIYKRSRSRTSSVTGIESGYGSLREIGTSSRSQLEEKRRGSDSYLPVEKWAVDYNNKNYIRSQCNKNKGLHRKLRGRPLDWQIEYDNNYFTRSKVNAPKGLHRKIPEVKRKYVPDKDDLADATGWEFDCGPEFDQEEQDVHYIPGGKVIRRGAYRWYGVKRNDSDSDIKKDEQRENILTEEMEKELKYGPEFPQSDLPHLSLSEEKDRKYSRGGYRHYEVLRNTYDIKPEELASANHDPEWKRKHHSNGLRYLDLDMCNYDLDEDLRDHCIVKGKPFRRTILNKVYELEKVQDPRDSSARARTRLSLIPGEGEKTVYEGVPERYGFKTKKVPSIRNVFKKKSEKQKYKSSREGTEFEEYERSTEQSYREELTPEYEKRLKRMAGEKVNQRRRLPTEQERYPDAGESESEIFQEYAYRVKSEDHSSIPKHHSMETSESPTDDGEIFEIWRDNITNSRKEEMQSQSRMEQRSRDRALKDSSRDTVTVKQRKEEYDEDDRYPYRNTIRNARNEHTQGLKHRHKGSTVKYERADSKDRSPVVEKLKARGNKYDDDPSYKKSKSSRDFDYEYSPKHGRKSNILQYEKPSFEDLGHARDKAEKKFPPHVAKRMKEIREKMERKIEQVAMKHREEDNGSFRLSENDGIELMKHRKHPKDRGHSHNSEYEKYVTRNGSEFWIKKEEKFTELHHKDHR